MKFNSEWFDGIIYDLKRMDDDSLIEYAKQNGAVVTKFVFNEFANDFRDGNITIEQLIEYIVIVVLDAFSFACQKIEINENKMNILKKIFVDNCTLGQTLNKDNSKEFNVFFEETIEKNLSCNHRNEFNECVKTIENNLYKTKDNIFSLSYLNLIESLSVILENDIAICSIKTICERVKFL